MAAPAWHKKLPADRRGVWTHKESKFRLSGAAFWNAPVRIILKNGAVMDGTMGDERNRWNGAKHAVAIRIPGRKTQKWIPVATIARVYGDRGPKLEDLLKAVILASHE